MSVKSIDAACLTGVDDNIYVQLRSTTVHVELAGGRSNSIGRQSRVGFSGALLAGGESFPEEVFTGGFAVALRQ